jgi:hypothetical protein
MTMNNIGFQEVAELASHLTPTERMQLVAYIGAGLSAETAEPSPGDAIPGSPTAVLRAMNEPPHLSTEDVGELDKIIETEKLPVRQPGVFDREDPK